MNKYTEDELLRTDEENSEGEPSNLALMKYLQSMKADLCTKDDLNTLKTSVKTDIKTIETKVNDNKNELDELNRRLLQYESESHHANFIQELNKQRALRNNLSIMGIPLIEGENLIDIVTKVFALLKCSFTSDQIESTYRTKGKKSMIITKLASYETKQSILKAKSTATIKLKDIIRCNNAIVDDFVYVNNHATPYFGKLLQAGRAAQKENRIFSCWLASSGCLFKLQEGSQSLAFRSTDELNKLIENPPLQCVVTSLKEQHQINL